MSRVLGLVVSMLGWLSLIAFAGAYLGYYVPPEALWSLQILALALPVIVLALIPLTILSFVTGHARLGIAQVVAVLLFALRHIPFGFVGTEDAADAPDAIQLLTYNSKAGNTARSEDSSLVDLFEAINPDVACLQEYLVIPTRSDRIPAGMLSRAFYSMGYQTATGVSPSQPETRRPILTRFPIVEEEILSLGRATQSYAVRAVLSGPGGDFAVYNLHFQGFTADRPWRGGSVLSAGDWIDFFQKSRGAYLSRATEARALRVHLESEPNPFLVCGDLNTTSNHWDYRHIARGLYDAFERAGEGWGKTYHARFPIVRIDYVLASSTWSVMSSEVHGPLSSDHRPLTATLRLHGPE